MSVVQLADLRDESARRAWGDELLTADAVLGYMSEKAIETIPATHIVPLSSLREALGRNKQTRMVNWEAYSDEYLADRFAALSTPADTAEPRHGGVPRFRRSQVDVSVMRPANPESEASIQRVGEPCLVVRMKSEFARTAY